MEISLPLSDGETINSVQLLLLFDYRLHVSSMTLTLSSMTLCSADVPQEYVELSMESAAFIEATSPVSGSSLFVSGVLGFRQVEPLQHQGRRDLYAVSGDRVSSADKHTRRPWSMAPVPALRVMTWLQYYQDTPSEMVSVST